MENQEVIKWVLGIIVTVIGWLVLNNLQQDKKLISIEAKVERMDEKLDELKELVKLFIGDRYIKKST
jgi:hypothetical protein